MPILWAWLAGCSCKDEPVSPLVDDVPFDPAPEPTEWGSYLSMRPTNDGGRLALAYFAPYDTAVGFALGTPREDRTVSWAHERVDGWPQGGLDTEDLGAYTSLAMDADGVAWIAYQDRALGGLFVAHRTQPGVWVTALADTQGGAFASIAIGTDGQPMVAHVVPGAASVRLCRLPEGGTWTCDGVYQGTDGAASTTGGGTVPVPASVGHTRLAVLDGVAWLAFADLAAGESHLADVTSGFEDDVIDDQGAGTFPSISAIDGTLRVVWYEDATHHLELATRTGTSWGVEVLDAGDHRGADPELFLLDGALAVVYQDTRAGDLVLATKSSDWAPATLAGEEGALGFHNEVVVIGDTPWVASYDWTTRTPTFLAL
jgi:hypothetical protein